MTEPRNEASTPYGAGFSIGRVVRLVIAPGARWRVILFVLAVGVVASVFVGSFPEDRRLLFGAIVGGALVAAGLFAILRYRNPAVAGALMYVGSINIALGAKGDGDAGWLLVIAAVCAGLGALMFIAAVVRAVRREKELERLVEIESTSIAFFVTMIVAITYALFESLAGLPKVSMWLIWTLGMATWVVVSTLFRRRYW